MTGNYVRSKNGRRRKKQLVIERKKYGGTGQCPIDNTAYDQGRELQNFSRYKGSQTVQQNKKRIAVHPARIIYLDEGDDEAQDKKRSGHARPQITHGLVQVGFYFFQPAC